MLFSIEIQIVGSSRVCNGLSMLVATGEESPDTCGRSVTTFGGDLSRTNGKVEHPPLLYPFWSKSSDEGEISATRFSRCAPITVHPTYKNIHLRNLTYISVPLDYQLHTDPTRRFRIAGTSLRVLYT